MASGESWQRRQSWRGRIASPARLCQAPRLCVAYTAMRSVRLPYAQPKVGARKADSSLAEGPCAQVRPVGKSLRDSHDCRAAWRRAAGCC
eukprot:365992-Chlamydomonas_euryale.AAC.6